MTEQEILEAGNAIIGGPALDHDQELPEAIEPDLEAFPWLADHG